ncbi:damage-inducible protein DinB [Putridiphycobacter roseus]|uniref:Damage-inducible protein DinB n=1 Tax=Putridiphycobacter roseus TaxID=2219161 RepID=A0A2W1NQ82_9FLAO|nr:DinB family protein [Putridiphycobacter roseus]PZE16788.1 damage-inducible protein DinB [Putridiphycobacter roseus]
MSTDLKVAEVVISPAQLLAHWQGHRNVTRRVIEAFPEKELFNFSIGGMRTFAELTMELIGIAGPGLNEIVTGEKAELVEKFNPENKKANLLAMWDQTTKTINELWPKLTPARFQESIIAFGMYEGTVQSTLFYFIDNEIHHRGQGYVYLRSLGIAPPFFYER